jgi:S-DNA-T family DNA segregation ATPase FtsK/SpoIIIE
MIVHQKISKRPLIAEAVAILLLVVAALIFLSLASYDPRDPSWNSASPEPNRHNNSIGPVGAILADLLLQFLGLTAFAIPTMLVAMALRLFLSEEFRISRRRLLVSSLALIAISGFLSLFPDFNLNLLRNSHNGGMVGYFVERGLVGLLSTTGAAIVLAAFPVITLMLALEISLLDLLARLRKPSRELVRRGSRGGARLFGRLKSWWGARRLRARKNAPAAVRAAKVAVALGADMPVEPARAAALDSGPTPHTSDAAQVEVVRTPHIQREARATKPTMAKKTVSASGYILPPIDLLEVPLAHHQEAEEELRERARILAEKCKEFAVTGHIHRINPGPVVTTFEFKPDPGIKYSRVVGLAEDLCLALKAESIRIDRIPGRSTVGIEVPNSHREKIFLREVIESAKFQNSESKLTLALGKTINGEEYVADLSKMPHLLIAGATGAGKSVTLNCIICSILYKASPDEVKFIMVDPKRLELGLYDGIPHLLTPIVTDPKRAANALKWAVNEMEGRYRQLAEFGVRNIDQYNRQVREAAKRSPDAPRPLPYIVIAIDELSDLMITSRGEVETSIVRLAQMARAVGIHLVVATQRPSVDVITGVIKANFPSRIAFRVSSKVDSRTIIDSNGAEALLGQGDMLFLPPASSRLIRVHGAFVGEAEIMRITDHARSQAQPDYNEAVTMSEQEAEHIEELDYTDELYESALEVITDMGRASTSVLQRRLSIGYGRAAKILDIMERQGLIGPAEGAKPRKVLPAAYELLERLKKD